MTEYGSKVGAVNGWRCSACQAVTYCVHVDQGVTPMFLGCRRDGCLGTGTSLMYPPPPVPAHVLNDVAWEWYKPSKKQLKRFDRKNPAMAEHIRLGGLALRELTDAGRLELEKLRGETQA